MLTIDDLPPVRNAKLAQVWVMAGCAVVPWHYQGTGKRRRKRPTIKGWTNGSAFTTVEQVKEHWLQHPDYPGIVTGPVSGVWVLDLDGPEGIATIKRLLAEHGMEKFDDNVLRVKTPRGGWHYYFRWSEGVRNSQGKLGPGVDVRGQGGFAAAPGAVVDGGEYTRPEGEVTWQEAPAWLLDLVRAVPATSPWEGGSAAVESAEALADAQPGEQDGKLFAYLAAQHRRGVSSEQALSSAWDVVQGWVLGDPSDPWTYEDVQEKVRSIWARDEFRGVTAPLEGWERDVVGQLMNGRALNHGSALPVVPASSEVSAMDNLVLEEVIASQVGAPHDRANARSLALFAQSRLRVIGEKDWLVWDGRRWAPDEKFARFGIVEELSLQLLVDMRTAPFDERDVLYQRSKRLSMVGGRDAALNAVRDLLAITQDELDPDQYVLNCRNGLLDLRTGELRPSRPEDLVTKLIDVDFDPEARDEVWERVLVELLPLEDDRLWLQKWFGYCLTGDVSEKAICCLHGPADSGKSTLSESFRLVLGDTQAGGYAQTWESEVFEARSTVNKAEKVSGLDNARLVVGSELAEGVRMNSAFVKAITGGEAIGGRALFKKSGSYKPRLKLMMHTNHIPRSGDLALQKRLRFIYLDRALTHEEKDPTIIKHLQDDRGPDGTVTARRAILAWAVTGCLRWQREGLGMPARQEEELSKFRRESDHLVEFVEDALEPSDSGWPSKTELRMAYEGWCGEQGYTPVKPTTLKQGLETQGLEFVLARQGENVSRVWRGVRVKWKVDFAALSERIATESEEM